MDKNLIKKKNIKPKMSDDDIKDKLKEYTIVDDITKVDIGTHLRYFSIDDKGNKLFRLGGFLNKVNFKDGYIVLGNNKITWSVQIKTSEFYKKMSYNEIKQKVEIKVKSKYLKKLQLLQEENTNLKNALKEIKRKYKRERRKD